LYRIRARHLVTLIVPMLLAQTGQAEDLNSGREHVLSGHTFLPSQYVTEPWVASTFLSNTGGGVAVDLKTPFYDRNGDEIFVLRADVFYASLNLGFQQHLGQTLAVGMTLGSRVRTGTNSLTFVTEGANVDRLMNIWAKKRVVRGEHDQLTLGVNWHYNSLFLVTPRAFASDIINGVGLANTSLMNKVKGWASVVTAEYAHAFTPTYGVRANARIGLHEDPYAVGTARSHQRLGVLLEMDLAPRHGVPLGLTLGRTQGFPADDPNAGLSGTLLGVWFTGRQALDIGAEFGLMTIPDRAGFENTEVMFGIFSIRYYF